MAGIRKHKEFLVLFLALIFVVYAKQYGSLNIGSNSGNPDRAFYKNLLAFTPGHYSTSATEHLSGYTFGLKKYLADKAFIHQASCFVKFTAFYKTTFNVTGYNLPSILKLICILRI